MFQLLYHTQLSLSVDFCLCTWIILFCIVLPIISLSMDEWKTEKYSINLFVCIEIWDSFRIFGILRHSKKSTHCFLRNSCWLNGLISISLFFFHLFERPNLDTDDCEQCTRTLEELENIDDDCDRHGITFVKTKDFSVAEQFGVHDFPALVYFESSIPNVFEG